MKLFSTSCETVFLGWDSPLLPRAVEYLQEKFISEQRWDLSSLICVLPASRSADRLRSLLRLTADANDLQLIPPRIITVGQLPECLYQPPSQLALDFEQTLAWARVLTAANPDDLRPLIPQLPPAGAISPWMELALTLRRLHEELATNKLVFADVIEQAETESEMRRWRLLSHLFEKYLQQLQHANLSDPHWARRQATIHDQCQTDKTLVLIGVSDLNDSIVQMLRSLECDMLALVAAPPNEFARFDEFGCADTSSWIQHHLPLRDDQLVAAGDVSDQASAVAETIADFAAVHSADEVTVGVTDESQVGPVEIELRGCGATTHRYLGWTVAQTAVGRLLSLAATFLQRQSWQSLAALLRHADVHAFVSRQLDESQATGDWLTDLDALLANHFPIRVHDPLPPVAVKRYSLAIRVSQIALRWLSDFDNDDSKPIAAWSPVIDQWIGQLYGDDVIAVGHDRTVMSRDSLRQMLERFAQLNETLDVPVTGCSAIEMIAARLADLRVVHRADPEDIDILGWLDLALDDAPALVVVGLNHPFVPAAVTSDPFLPGALRSQLRMADNDRRYARDAYAMHLMLTTRPSVRFVVGRIGADGSPTPPSRLLAASPPTASARRIRQLLGERRESVSVRHQWDDGSDATSIVIPELPIESEPSELVSCMSVTAFRDYLVCPYRFFLRHVLKLRPLDDASSELAANQFGDLVHGALELFGLSADKDEDDPKRIEASLIEHLQQYADQNYGNTVSTAVRLQVEQAKRRLKIVAVQQAARIAEGWRIYKCEASANPTEHGAGIDVDGKRMGLSGRFDRIDFHPQRNQWAILDYKTHGHKPEKKHLQKTDDGVRWIDLQLPLYRMMIPFLDIDADPQEVELGYFNVSGKEIETRVNLAEFTPQQMDDAVQLIHQCVRDIWAGKFEPTADRVPFDDYDMILQTGISNQMLDRADISSGEEVDV